MAEETTSTTPQDGAPAAPTTPPAATPAPAAPAIDYDKLADIINGRTSAAEDSALRGYFRQQGLTKEEAEQAMADFKAQKAAKTPDAAALQQQIAQANAAALQAQMTNRAMVMAGELGLDIKTVPYVMKLADLKEVVVDGAVSDDKLKEAINKVLGDLPQLKTTKTEDGGAGFRVGAGTSSTGTVTDDDMLRAVFNVKAKN